MGAPVVLPPFAENYLAETVDRRKHRIVPLFHRWLENAGKRVGDVTVGDIEAFLEQPSGRPIDHMTRNNHRYELKQYLRWLAERGLAGPFQREELEGYHRQAIPDELREFLRFLAPTHRPATVALYRSALRQFHRWLSEQNLQIEQVDRDACLRWSQRLHERGLHPSTRVGNLVQVRKYLDWLWERRRVALPGSACLRAEDFPKKPEYLPRPLAPDLDRELQDQLKKSKSEVGLGLYVMRRTGLRVGELRVLERDCVMADHAGRHFLKVPIGKLNNERLVPLDAVTLRVVTDLQKKAPASSPWLLEGARGRPMAADTYRSMLTRVATNVQPDSRITTHQLRHTFATSLMNGGMSLMGIMKLLGHHDYRMTLRYTSIADETVGREYFEALSRIAERYELLGIQSQPDASAFDPVAALTDIVRWITTEVSAVAECSRDAKLIHDANLVIRRLQGTHDDLQKLKATVAAANEER